MGVKAFTMRSASVTPTRPQIIVPTLPRSASLILSVSWVINWLATIRFRRYLRASDRIDSKLSVAKFWNSSTYRQKSWRSLSGISWRLIAACWNFMTKIMPKRLALMSPRRPLDRFTRKIFLLSMISRILKPDFT